MGNYLTCCIIHRFLLFPVGLFSCPDCVSLKLLRRASLRCLTAKTNCHSFFAQKLGISGRSLQYFSRFYSLIMTKLAVHFRLCVCFPLLTPPPFRRGGILLLCFRTTLDFAVKMFFVSVLIEFTCFLSACTAPSRLHLIWVVSSVCTKAVLLLSKGLLTRFLFNKSSPPPPPPF